MFKHITNINSLNSQDSSKKYYNFSSLNYQSSHRYLTAKPEFLTTQSLLFNLKTPNLFSCSNIQSYKPQVVLFFSKAHFIHSALSVPWLISVISGGIEIQYHDTFSVGFIDYILDKLNILFLKKYGRTLKGSNYFIFIAINVIFIAKT